MREIAAQAGVSKNTVSLALRGDRSIPPPTRDRICAIADRLGYRPNALVAQLLSQLRSQRGPGFQAKLALFNAHREAKAFRTHATIPAYVAGCQRRGAQLGYDFDEFWLRDPALRGDALLRVLRARGIRGAIVVGLMDHHQLPAHFAPVWQALPCVVTGVRTRDPALSFASVDHHDLVVQAFERALVLGYRRPALVLEQRIDRLVEGRFTGAMLTAQQALPARRRVPAFLEVEAARTDRSRFAAWFRRHRPDVLLSLYNVVFPWLAELGRRVPDDVGVIQLEWRAGHAEVAGMNQHNDAVGEAAVDMVVGQLHRNECGVPAFPRATLIGASWVDGSSVKAQAQKADDRTRVQSAT